MEARPDGIIGEEFQNENTDAEHVWVIDPFDGTKSFIERTDIRYANCSNVEWNAGVRRHRPANKRRTLDWVTKPWGIVKARHRQYKHAIAPLWLTPLSAQQHQTFLMPMAGRAGNAQLRRRDTWFMEVIAILML